MTTCTAPNLGAFNQTDPGTCPSQARTSPHLWRCMHSWETWGFPTCACMAPGPIHLLYLKGESFDSVISSNITNHPSKTSLNLPSSQRTLML